MNNIFDSVSEASVNSMTPGLFILEVIAALLVGFMISFIYSYKNKHSESFALTIALLPAIVCVVIMVVSGDIGAGIAVAGAFSLIRFRSAPGSAKEIIVIFLSMAVGLLIGRGYIAYGALFALIIGLIILICSSLNVSIFRKSGGVRQLRVAIPEDLDYNSKIEDILGEYTKYFELTEVRSMNMGSMFRLTYLISLKDDSLQKEFIDKIRVRNGNLEVAIMHVDTRSGL